uniref:Uncharacterized protein n=1 Tax=Anguilla anguilla TaxID=7936 RepID=A0A0E9SN09_ANGAN
MCNHTSRELLTRHFKWKMLHNNRSVILQWSEKSMDSVEELTRIHPSNNQLLSGEGHRGGWSLSQHALGNPSQAHTPFTHTHTAK